MKIITHLFAVLFVVQISGCGWLGIRDRSNDYLLAEETAKITVPEGLEEIIGGEVYPIPALESSAKLESDYEVPRPQPASVNNFEQVVKIQSFEDRRWVLVNVPPSELWPRIRNVLSRNGIPSSRADGDTGVIETVWITFKSDTDMSHRFRFYIAPGVQLDSTEIAAVHNQADMGSEASVDWPERSDSDKREQDMLAMLANELATPSSYSQVSLLAQNIGGDAKVRLVSDGTQAAHIVIALGFDRCWASVSYSAARGGFTVIDKNRSDGQLWVNYSPVVEAEPGFFSRLFSGTPKVDTLKVNYQIILESNGDLTQVRIFDAEGVLLSPSDSLRLLGILRSNLS